VERRNEEARRAARRGALVVAVLSAACSAPPAADRARSVDPAPAAAERALVDVVDLPVEVAPSAARGSDRLAVGDVLKIVVVGQPDLSIELPVPPSGAIELPVVGELAVLDRSVQEVGAELRERLESSRFLVNPAVSVSVSRVAPRRVFVVEGVAQPAAYELPAGGSLHLTQVIALAGGLSRGADASQVTIVRRRPDAPPQLLRIDLRAILERQRMDADPLLEPDDTVIVRDVKQGEEQVFVTGRVRTPGAYKFSPREGLSFLQSIVLAGGLDKYAKPAGAALLRRADEGRRTIRVDLARILAGDLDLDVALEPGDVVFVPESFF